MSKEEKEIENIAQKLREKPYLIEFIKECMALTREQRKQVLQMLQEGK